MKKLSLKDVSRYVENNIGIFHQKRIQSLDSLKLTQVLKRKNPYLFKAKYVYTGKTGQVDHLKTVQIDHLNMAPKNHQNCWRRFHYS